MPWLPNLTASNHVITSERSRHYNCIAWAAGDDQNWWWPSQNPDDKVIFWPKHVAREETIEAFIALFSALGYTLCSNGVLESGYKRITIYSRAGKPTHAAKQLQDGLWSSKLGRSFDIAHELNALDGPLYGTATVFLRKPHQMVNA